MRGNGTAPCPHCRHESRVLEAGDVYLCWRCGGYITPEDDRGYRFATEADLAAFPDRERRRYAVAARVFRTIDRASHSREEVTEIVAEALRDVR